MKLSTALSKARNAELHFPVRGIDGYAGEQDGDRVVFSEIYRAWSLTDVDLKFPDGVPSWARIHWATYHSGEGWTWVLGAWDSHIPSNAKWPEEVSHA